MTLCGFAGLPGSALVLVGTSFRVPLGFAEPGGTSLFTGALAPLLATLAFPPESAPADSLVTTEGQAHRADVLLSESVDGCVPLT